MATERSFTISDARASGNPLIFVNPAFERMTGYKADEVIGKNLRLLQGEDTDPIAVGIMRKAVTEGAPTTVTLLNYRKDGNPFWNEVSVAPLFDDGGELTHFVGVQVDVSAKVLAQSDLEAVYSSERSAHKQARDSQASLEAVLEQLPSGVVMADAATGKVTRFNSALENMLRWPVGADIKVGDKLFDLRKESGEVIPSEESPLSRAIRGGISIEPEEIIIRRGDGTDAIFSVRARPVLDENGNIVSAVAMMDDITQRKEWEHRLDEERKRSAALAYTLQRSLLPPSLPEGEKGVEFGAAYSPAAEGLYVGGDFYDVFEQRPTEWIMAIGDVMGKGAEAAAVTSFARHSLRTAALRTGKPSSLLGVLNQALMSDEEQRPFLTIALGLLSRTEDHAHLTLGLGGHPRPFLIQHSTGEVTPVGSAGTLIGVIDTVEIAEVELDLEPGDTLVMFTDGVTEAHGLDSFLGEEGLRNILQVLAPENLGASSLAARVQKEVTQFIGNGLKDDLAILVTKIV